MKTTTKAIHCGRDLQRDNGALNPLIDRTSTRIFPTLDAVDAAVSTGRLSDFLGSHTPDHVAAAVAELEGEGCEAMITSSGMSALTITLLTFLSAGDHVLMPDTVFGPTRDMAGKLLARLGIETGFYPALAPREELAGHFRDTTRLVLAESPGSNTFEVQDVPMIAALARETGALTAIDNSWATPVLFPPLAHGVDISICAATKYLVGHADAILGTIACRAELMPALQATARQLGDTPAPDAAWLLARGLRTLPLRLERHDRSARRVAEALATHPAVREVLHPALPGAAGHDLWRRDFNGASGLFAFTLPALERNVLEAVLDRMELFQLGFSWGGYESLILPVRPHPGHRLTDGTSTLLRLHVGLEDPDDLIADLFGGLDPIPNHE